MRKLLLAAGIALFAASACGGYVFPGASPSPDQGTVTGRILGIPCAPVESATMSPCAGRPMAGATVVFTSGGMTRAATTGQDGAYRIDLPAGTWAVSFKSILRILSGPPTVTVPAGGNVVANYVVDSGIRAPVPQQ